ncbi:MAG: hypothetical protein ACOY6K_09630 [Pseudomonadota bacterium]
MSEALFWVAGLGQLVGGAGAAWLLKRAWQAKIEARAPWLWGGWAVAVATILWPAWVLGPARGPFIALTLVPVAALALIATGMQIRAARAGRAGGIESLAPEPSERPSKAWRGVLRWLLAGPIGLIAALAVGIAYAAFAPGEPQTRLVVGGMIVPVAWGGAMAWTLADNRILRATAVLVGTALLGFGSAMLRGFS